MFWTQKLWDARFRVWLPWVSVLTPSFVNPLSESAPGECQGESSRPLSLRISSSEQMSPVIWSLSWTCPLPPGKKKVFPCSAFHTPSDCSPQVTEQPVLQSRFSENPELLSPEVRETGFSVSQSQFSVTLKRPRQHTLWNMWRGSRVRWTDDFLVCFPS